MNPASFVQGPPAINGSCALHCPHFIRGYKLCRALFACIEAQFTVMSRKRLDMNHKHVTVQREKMRLREKLPSNLFFHFIPLLLQINIRYIKDGVCALIV